MLETKEIKERNEKLIKKNDKGDSFFNNLKFALNFTFKDKLYNVSLWFLGKENFFFSTTQKLFSNKTLQIQDLV